MKFSDIIHNRRTVPSPTLSAIPVVSLLGFLIYLIIRNGAADIQDYAPGLLLGASALGLSLTLLFTRRPLRLIWLGMVKSARQLLPAVPLLILIATLSTTWMLSGVVPWLINFGIGVISPQWFLIVTCGVCALVSVLTGSSWTTIATIGVAFIGLAGVMGVSEAWVAGAIISGAYFGDKVSPLSDTTVLAASSCGIDLFRHIRFLLYTTLPAMTIALIVFGLVGYLNAGESIGSSAEELQQALASLFNLSPWVLLIPAATFLLIILRVNALATLAIGSLLGMTGIWVLQPQIAATLAGATPSVISSISASCQTLFSGLELTTASETLDSLVATYGIMGMKSTVLLVMCAMIFGGIMIGTGMLGSLTRSFTRMLRGSRSLVGATVMSGLFLNSCTGDQYLSIIIGGNIYRATYRHHNLADEMLSRSLEDSISVTSVLIPWNSCGVTQASVLGVATLAYLPCCIFNLLSPVLSVTYALIGFKIRHRQPAPPSRVALSNIPA